MIVSVYSTIFVKYSEERSYSVDEQNFEEFFNSEINNLRNHVRVVREISGKNYLLRVFPFDIVIKLFTDG